MHCQDTRQQTYMCACNTSTCLSTYLPIDRCIDRCIDLSTYLYILYNPTFFCFLLTHTHIYIYMYITIITIYIYILNIYIYIIFLSLSLSPFLFLDRHGAPWIAQRGPAPLLQARDTSPVSWKRSSRPVRDWVRSPNEGFRQTWHHQRVVSYQGNEIIQTMVGLNYVVMVKTDPKMGYKMACNGFNVFG